MTVKVILRCAPILTKDDLMDVENVRHHEMFQTGSLTPVRRGIDAQGKNIYLDVPVCINHEKSNVVGVVTCLREDSDHTGGRWLFAHARIDKPPGWLKRDTSVSISYKILSRSSGLWGDWTRVESGWLTEISLLSPSRDPAHPRARVVWLEEEQQRSPAAGVSSEHAAGEVIHGGRLIRREFPAVITFRSARGEVIRNEPNGSQTIWASEADYRADVAAVR